MSADTITAEQLTAIKSYAAESIDGAFEIYRKHLVAEIDRLSL